MNTNSKKFRTWSTTSKLMSPIATCQEMIIGSCMSYQGFLDKGVEKEHLMDNFIETTEALIFMESVGKQDDDGKEIFEGDIIKYGNGADDVGAVEKHNYIMLVKGFYSTSFDTPWDAFSEKTSKMKIIGNIYENDDLIPKK